MKRMMPERCRGDLNPSNGATFILSLCFCDRAWSEPGSLSGSSLNSTTPILPALYGLTIWGAISFVRDDRFSLELRVGLLGALVGSLVGPLVIATAWSFAVTFCVMPSEATLAPSADSPLLPRTGNESAAASATDASVRTERRHLRPSRSMQGA